MASWSRRTTCSSTRAGRAAAARSCASTPAPLIFSLGRPAAARPPPHTYSAPTQQFYSVTRHAPTYPPHPPIHRHTHSNGSQSTQRLALRSDHGGRQFTFKPNPTWRQQQHEWPRSSPPPPPRRAHTHTRHHCQTTARAPRFERPPARSHDEREGAVRPRRGGAAVPTIAAAAAVTARGARLGAGLPRRATRAPASCSPAPARPHLARGGGGGASGD
jgi:hypothetical protein